jgi:PilZ domain-containing protein
MTATSDERRTLLRKRSFLQGRLYFNNRRSSLDCLVRDISDQGAKLKVSDSIAIPEFVELHIPNKDETYRAKVQWRTGFEIGVTFENDQEAPSIVPSAGPADLLERVRRLEAEVASLHRKVNELQNELRHGQGSGI